MKAIRNLIQICFLSAALLPLTMQAQFECTIYNASVTITGYSGSSNSVVIPSIYAGLPVTSIGQASFANDELTSVTIPDSVTSIGDYAFYNCYHLSSVTVGNGVANIGECAFANDFQMTSFTVGSGVTNIGILAFGGCGSLALTVDTNNTFYSGVAGALFNRNQTTLIRYPSGQWGSYTVPSSVTVIGANAFNSCGLTSVIIPNSVRSIGESAFEDAVTTNIVIGNGVTNIGDDAFVDCGLPGTGIYFAGNAPSFGLFAFAYYGLTNNATVYYLPGTTGWNSFPPLGDPLEPWFLPNPLILNFEPNFGVQTNEFGFTISWATNASVVVEGCTNLASSLWKPIQTNTLIGGTSYFGDPHWTNYPVRFYRLRSP